MDRTMVSGTIDRGSTPCGPATFIKSSLVKDSSLGVLWKRAEMDVPHVDAEIIFCLLVSSTDFTSISTEPSDIV